jgi:hypothetical protein
VDSQISIIGVATGIVFSYHTTRPNVNFDSVIQFGAPYFSIAFSLNFLLTLMVVIRLILHRRNIQKVMGGVAGADTSYKAAVTILVESSALYTTSCLLYAGPWAAKSSLQFIFLQIFAQAQVRPMLIFPDG